MTDGHMQFHTQGSREARPRMFPVIMFRIKMEQPKSSRNIGRECSHKMWFVHTVRYCMVVKINEQNVCLFLSICLQWRKQVSGGPIKCDTEAYGLDMQVTLEGFSSDSSGCLVSEEERKGMRLQWAVKGITGVIYSIHYLSLFSFLLKRINAF